MERIDSKGEINDPRSEKSIQHRLGAAARRSINWLIGRDRYYDDRTTGEELFLHEQYGTRGEVVQSLRKGTIYDKKGDVINPRDCLPRYLDEQLIFTYVSIGISSKKRKYKVFRPYINKDTLAPDGDKYHGYLIEAGSHGFVVHRSYVIDVNKVKDIDEPITIGSDASSDMKLESIVRVKDMNNNEAYVDHRSGASGEVRNKEWCLAKLAYEIDREISIAKSRQLASPGNQ